MSHTLSAAMSVHSLRDAAQTLRVPRDKTQHIFVPFIGGRDDQAALRIALQFAHSPDVVVTVAHLTFDSDDHTVEVEVIPTAASTSKDVVKQQVISEPSASDLELLSAVKTAATTSGCHVSFIEVAAESPKDVPRHAIAAAQEVVGRSRDNVGDMMVVGRRHACLEHLISTESGLERDFQRTVGVLADGLSRAGIAAGVLVMNESDAK